jgi:hypothetical protein
MSIRTLLLYVLLFVCSVSIGQINQYGYRRELTGIEDQWHKVILPDEIFEKVMPGLSDIRIFGITEKKDTIEAAYILQPATEKIVLKDVPFKLINQSKNARGYYYTFAIRANNSINQIRVDFDQQNFDWRLTLEGSQDQQEWFSIVEDYRILSIKNELTDFKFTDVVFQDSKYTYFRMNINSAGKPGLIAAKLSLIDSIDGSYRKYKLKLAEVSESKQNKQTIIAVDLKSVVPVCWLKIYVKGAFDYYRPITIEYITDSIKAQKGWVYNYNTLSSGMLSSFGNNVFAFNSTMLKKLKIIIENRDNKPLQIDSIAAKGNVYSLICRFTEPATYYLTYGNVLASRPDYDIDHFTDMIPKQLKTLQLGNEQLTGEKITSKTGPLFQNKMWLWAIMTLIIVLLGWFSLSLMKKK